MQGRGSKQRDGMQPQDRAVLELLLQSKSRAQIVRELGMAEGTVNVCCTRVFKQAGCHSLAELIYRYKREPGGGG